MRIEYIVQARMPTEKAHGLQIAHMCNAFAELGHEVTLVVPVRARLIKESLFSYYGIPERFAVRILWSPDLISVPGVSRVTHWLHSFLFVFRLLFYRPKKDSIIYTRSAEIAWLFGIRGYRVVCEVHDWPESHASLFTKLLQRATLLPCNSEGTEAVCRAHGLARTMVAHNGIDVEEFSKSFDKEQVRKELGIPLGKKIVMYIGALEKWKGVETLAQSADLLPEDVQVVVIGGSEKQTDELRKKYPRVMFLGTRPYRELAKNQSASDVLVVPNIPLNTESEKYTSPIKLFAHMASGVPTIVSDLPSLRAIVGDESAYFFQAGDVEGLASVIKKVLKNSKESEKRAQKAREVVQKFSWKERGEKILSTIQNQ